MKKTVIVGGVAAGASCAARLRRLDEEAEIVLFEKGDYISFANCGLPYYLGDIIQERNHLLVATPKLLHERFNIDVRTQSEVIALDVHKKILTVSNKEKGIYTESYDRLVLAPGAKPIIPPLPGVTDDRIFTLRNIADTDRLKTKLQSLKTVTIVGGGYIGVEMAENLCHLGIEVNLVEAAPHILAPFDEDIIPAAEKTLQQQGVHLHLSTSVTGFQSTSAGIVTHLNNHLSLEAEAVILAIGITPDTAFLKNTPLTLSKKGHILVNEKLETNIEDIYAAGDAIEVIDFINGMHTAIPLAGPANKQGRIIADRLAGLTTTYQGTQGSTVIKIFDKTLAATGNNERLLNQLGILHHTVLLHPNAHAGYYPHATPLTLKIIFNEKGKLLGAQAFGQEGVEKRIDVLATVIRLGGTIYDLTTLELCYAPPYSSSKDPVNFAGYIAENMLTGKAPLVHPRDITEIKNEDAICLLDVRTQKEYEKGHLKNAINIPVDSLRSRLNELSKDLTYWVYCGVGLRSHTATLILRHHGFDAKNITGGWQTIQTLGLNK
jgi:NADPH-dependent 2,4-dienoyl-CoA reductase/sulfur reductase-like enzyme/rhodanese-related sulfurtransferase